MKLNEIIRKIKNKFKKFFNFLSRRKYKEKNEETGKLQFNPVLKYSMDDLEYEDEEELDFLLYSKNPT